ncbi:hypothetical protein PPERSA_03500 [Pseudocohnilembus persalinus]|uniref:Ribosome assembly factor mrt4 n=1 Tax=Pseudocohnilembus persalinus TaxID=266149 RepID=A0A0V0QBU3_PSEPJ|nr:hypothetical protein PPERSA_03500 [Pseudocohnilembus persalinus]|eukprot:KRW99699.1 hypothetical protein PPERSA_03500 [Pseudocohnilembus persalinus]
MSTHPDFYVVQPTKGQIDSNSNQELIIKRRLETSPDEHCNFKIKIQLQQQVQDSEQEKQQKNNEQSDLDLDLQNKQNIQKQEENEISQKQLQQSLQRQREQKQQQENIQKLQNDQNVNEVIILHNDNNYYNKYQEASIDFLDMKKKLEQLMPKSKRSKVVKFTKTSKKTADHKEQLVTKIHQCLEKYDSLYLFKHDNMTTVPFRQIQEELSDSKFFLGKNKVMQVGLGKSEEDSYKTNSYKISEDLVGESGLFFTNKTEEEVLKYFGNFGLEEYAKAGAIADKTIILNKGSDVFSKFSHSIEPYLRKLGLTTSLYMGEIQLNGDFVLAQNGVPLNPEQCKILKLLKIKMGQFKITMVAQWKNNGSYKRYQQQ